jgi:SAM-dependent methyltransferase
MIQNPKSYWQGVSEKPEWKDYILPGRDDAAFNAEGLIEAQRLFYFFDNKSAVIDYGCGIGRVLQYVADRAGHVVGLDISGGFIQRAAEIVKRDNVAFFLSDEYQKENVADLVYSLMVLQHNDKASRIDIVTHIFKLLKYGRCAVISFPKFESTYYQETDSLHKFTQEEVELFGRMFSSYRIVEGNLPAYEIPCDKNINNEYYLIAVK